MKYFVSVCAIAALFVAEPALAASLSDPAVSADIVAADATSSSTTTTDTIVLTIMNILILMMAGGAF